MRRVILTGTKNGSNTSFVLPETSVTGGVTLIAHTNIVLHEVGSAPAVGEYTITGSTVTVGLAPASGDSLIGYITTDLDSGISPVDLIGARDGASVEFTLPEAPLANSSLLVFYSGVLLEETSGTPTPNQFQVVGTTLTLGLAPGVNEDVQVFQEGGANAQMQLLSAVTLTQTSMTLALPTTTLARDHAPILLVIYTGILLKAVEGNPSVNEYTVTMTSGVPVIRFGIIPDSDRVDIYIIGVEVIATGTHSYQIFKHIYALGPEVEYIFSAVSQMRLQETSVFTLDRLDPNRECEGSQPSCYAYRGRDENGSLLIELYPVPSEPALIRYAGIRRDACSNQAHVLRGLDALIVNAAAAAVLQIIIAKYKTAEPWQSLALQYQQKANQVLERLLELDFIKSGVAQVQGMREDHAFPTDGRYLAEHDIGIGWLN